MVLRMGLVMLSFLNLGVVGDFLGVLVSIVFLGVIF